MTMGSVTASEPPVAINTVRRWSAALRGAVELDPDGGVGQNHAMR